VRGRLHVNPFGVVVPPARDEPEERETIGFLGNYTHPPNVDAAVWLAREILPRLHELRPGARLRLAGPYAPAAVRELAGPGVEVLGQVPDADRFIRHCAVVLAPVRIGGGMRMKVLHAMALGRPVVTTRRGIEGLALNGRTPPLAVADDAAGIAAVTAELLADRAARRALGARARAFVVEHHGPDAVARRLEAVYDRALATRGKRP
jgi:glycosyltransferase involved in cell wall biosynthesis